MWRGVEEGVWLWMLADAACLRVSPTRLPRAGGRALDDRPGLGLGFGIDNIVIVRTGATCDWTLSRSLVHSLSSLLSELRCYD